MLARSALAALLALAACAPPAPPPETTADTTDASAPGADQAPPGQTDALGVTTLSEREIRGYLAGEGMGLAVPAELNHYPGPRHVLDLRDTLGLSAEQQAQAEQLRDRVAEEAPRLGEAYVAAERALDSLFVYQVATDTAVRRRAQAAEDALAELRALHLAAHVAMRDTLRPAQIALYDELRGYPADTTSAAGGD